MHRTPDALEVASDSLMAIYPMTDLLVKLPRLAWISPTVRSWCLVKWKF